LAGKEDLPMTDIDFDRLWDEITGGASDQESPAIDPELDEEQEHDQTPQNQEMVEEIAEKLEAFMEDNDWKSFSKTTYPDGTVYYTVYMNVDKVSLRAAVQISDDPLAMRIIASLPLVCPEEYRLIVDQYIVNFNSIKRYGGLLRHDGSIDYSYAFSVAEGFNADAFQRYFIACLYSAAEAYPELSKLAVGKLSRKKTAECLEKLNALIIALKE
jgi:hypothetical protein